MYDHVSIAAGKTTTDAEIDDLIESGNLQVFTQDVSTQYISHLSLGIFLELWHNCKLPFEELQKWLGFISWL